MSGRRAIINTDLSVSKNFRLGGSKSAQIKLEMINLFNRVQTNSIGATRWQLDVRRRSRAVRVHAHHAGDVPLLVLDSKGQGHRGEQRTQRQSGPQDSGRRVELLLCAPGNLCWLCFSVALRLCVLVAAACPWRSRSGSAAPRAHLLSHLWLRQRAAVVRARRAVPPQLRVRRRHRGLPAGAEGRSRFRDGLLGRGARLQPAALVQRGRRQGARGARELAPTRGAVRPRRRPRARRGTWTPSSGCSATATRRRATAPTPIAWRELQPPLSRRRRGGGVLRAGAAGERFRPASATRRSR